MDAADHTLKETNVPTEERGYGAIVAAAVALVFIGFVVHAATLPVEKGEAGAAHATTSAAPKAAH